MLLHAEDRNIDDVQEEAEDEEAIPPTATQEEVSAAKDQAVRNYIEEQQSSDRVYLVVCQYQRYYR